MADRSHQCELIAKATHLVNSPHVTLFNWCSVFALTITDAPTRVVRNHKISHDTRVDLPIPRPETVESRIISVTIPRASRVRPSRIYVASARSTVRCQSRGPWNFSSGVSFLPHGKANRTNFSGSSATSGVHNWVISARSSDGA